MYLCAHKARKTDLAMKTVFKFSSSKLSQIPEHGKPEFAFIGRSNVGKSSLINMLSESKLAKVSATPELENIATTCNTAAVVKWGAIIGMVIGTLCMTVLAVLVNKFVMLPFYMGAFHMDMNGILSFANVAGPTMPSGFSPWRI